MLTHTARKLAVPAFAAAVISWSATSSAASSDTLFTEPGQGFSQVYNLINGAATSIDMTMYELTDTTAEQDLAAAASRGVTVRVILDGREQNTNSAAYSYLNSHGVKTVWSSSSYYYTHEKSIVIDGTTAVIMSANLTSQYYSTSRDFGVVDTSHNDVAAVDAVFNADYAGNSVTPGDGDDLIWSPTDSQTQLLALINGATSSLRVYCEELSDTSIVNALASAAKRGVSVQLVGENESNEYASEYTTLKNAGVKISYYSSSTGFYIHAKVVEADYGTASAKAFIGSENFTNTSLNENRELGLIVTDSAILSSLESTFTADFNGGTTW